MKLDEFVNLPDDRQPKCYTCRLPQEILAQVNAARQSDAPIPYETISKWLRSEGHTIQKYALRNHFEARHVND